MLRLLACGLLPLLSWVGPAAAQGGEQSTPATQPTTPAATQPAATASAPAGPKYERNRADDDFRYLDGPPGSYKPDLFDPLKRIHLGNDFTLRLGGEARGRVEAVTHRRLGSNEGNRPGQFPTQDTYFLHRYYYHADFQYRKLARFFVEGVSAWIEDRDMTAVPNPTDRFDAHQMFADLRFLGEDVPLTLRFGRQELSYGNERMVGTGDWNNVRRAWDGVKVFWADEKLSVEGFFAHPAEIRPRRPDWYDETIDFYGLYSTYKFLKDHGLDVYSFAVRNDDAYTNANYRTGDVGDLSNYTLGSRLWGSRALGPGLVDYENELAGQWGKASGDTIQAWLWSFYGGYTQTKWPWKPRLGFGVDYASGDEDPFDDIHQTWNPLFPTAHRHLGYLDVVGRQNIWSENVNLTLKPTDRVTTQVAWYNYSLVHRKDALYNKAGGVIRRFPYGGVGAQVGNEIDLTVTWQLDAHASMLFGYSHFWTSGGFFNRRNQPEEDPDLFYLQYQYKF